MPIYDNVKKACSEKGISVMALETKLNFPRGSIYKMNEHAPNIKKVILAKNNLRVGVGVLHPLYHRTSVSWSELNGEKPVIPKLQNNLALEKLMRRGASEGVTFSEHLLAKTTEEVLGYVATGKYICFGGDIGPAVDSGVGDYIKFIPVLEGENVLGWPVLAYREDNGNPLIQTMIKVYESEIIG